MLIQLFCKLLIFKHCFHAALRIVKVAVNCYNVYVISGLSHHLHLLYLADYVLRIEHNDPCTFYIGKTCHSSLTGISRSCCQDHDLILHVILLS